MLRNNLTHAFRALRRDRIYTALNLVGLATGLAAALLVLLWVQDEMTYDRSHRQGKNIARVLTNREGSAGGQGAQGGGCGCN